MITTQLELNSTTKLLPDEYLFELAKADCLVKLEEIGLVELKGRNTQEVLDEFEFEFEIKHFVKVNVRRK